MKIDNIKLGQYPVLLAPMEDVTDLGFRLMCKQFGADLVYTEFVSSDALIRQVNKSMQKLTISDDVHIPQCLRDHCKQDFGNIRFMDTGHEPV